MRQQIAQHKLALTLVTGRMRHAPLAWLLMVAVIGVTLSLPAMFYVALENLHRLAGGLQTTPQISVFMHTDAKEEQRLEVEGLLKKHDGIASYRFISRKEAWKEMQEKTGLAEITGGLEQNPLPDAFVVEMKSGDPVLLEPIQKEIEQWPGVEHAQLDAAWVKRLHSVLALGNKLVMVMAALLGVALLIITGNSIRLQIATQREEIELSRLIGATDRFIRRPFLYAGTLYGIGGGLVALLILYAALLLFNASVAELAKLYASDFSLIMPAIDFSLALVGGSALLGWIGAYFAVNRSLAEIERY